jgi:hypothetical protein
MLAPVGAPLSPALIGRGLDRRLDGFEVPLVLMRDAADAVGGTVNDVFLAAVAGGLHDYHARLGQNVPALRFTMPISVRDASDPRAGNRFVPARFVMPIDDPDPAIRARLAADIVRKWRDEPAMGLSDLLAGGLARLPGPVVTQIFGGLLRNIDVDVVDVPGMRGPTFLAGARVERMWAYAPPTGAALSITLLSHVTSCCVSILSDLTAVSNPELLAACLKRAFDEVLALVPDRARDLPA